jgi:hypothetical protein
MQKESTVNNFLRSIGTLESVQKSNAQVLNRRIRMLKEQKDIKNERKLAD